jgi:hypothetical protein
VCGWTSEGDVLSSGRSLTNHIRYCVVRKQRNEERMIAKRTLSVAGLGDNGGGPSDHPPKSPRLSEVCVYCSL